MQTSLTKKVAVLALACLCNPGFVLAETAVLDNAPLQAVENRTQRPDFEAFADIPSNPQDPEQLAIQGRFVVPAVIVILAYDAVAIALPIAIACASRPDGCALTYDTIKKLPSIVVNVVNKVKAICAKPSVSVC